MVEGHSLRWVLFDIELQLRLRERVVSGFREVNDFLDRLPSLKQIKLGRKL